MRDANLRKSRGQHVHISVPAVYTDARITTAAVVSTHACAQNWFIPHMTSTVCPLFFHAKIQANTSGIQRVVPTFHRAYNKQSEVYIKF